MERCVNLSREAQILEIVSQAFALADSKVLLGIGDDAAIVPSTSAPLLCASDLAVEDIHFNLNWSTCFEVGRRVVAANCADIYAMGAQPEYLLLNAVIPQLLSLEQIKELAAGIAYEARLAGCAVIGGDISDGAKLVLSISAFGYHINQNVDSLLSQESFLRSGAKIGDSIVLSNLTGASRLGFELLKAGDQKLIEKYKHLVDQFKQPKIAYEYAKRMALLPVNACIDVSDGLLSEVSHIAKSSSVDIKLIPEFWKNSTGIDALHSNVTSMQSALDDMQEVCNQLSLDLEKVILTGGEDHAFLVTTALPALVGGIQIGSVIERPKLEDQVLKDYSIYYGNQIFNADMHLGYRH